MWCNTVCKTILESIMYAMYAQRQERVKLRTEAPVLVLPNNIIILSSYTPFPLPVSLAGREQLSALSLSISLGNSYQLCLSLNKAGINKRRELCTHTMRRVNIMG